MSARPVIGYVGMTHLGLVSASASAGKGFETVAFDPDAALITRLKAGELPVREPDLPELISANRQRLHFTAAAADLARCDLIYVAPDVPTDDQGRADLGGVEKLLGIVGEAAPKAVLATLSQVPPGFSRAHAPAGRAYYCQVETLIFGQAVHRALQPERFIIGCADPAAPLAPPLAAYLAAFGCPILPMRYESAELAKISINMFLVASVTTTNVLAELCEKLGADWGEIAPSLRLDRRIGPHAYLAPGLGIAGGNLERDLAAVRAMAGAQGTDDGLVRAWLANSHQHRDWALGRLHERVFARQPDPLIGLWGLAYKQDTHSTKNSPALALLAALQPFRVRTYDPAVKPHPEFHPRLDGAASALAACDGADVLVIMTPWPEFRAVSPADVATKMRGRTVIDPFGVLPREACWAAGLVHHVLGRKEA